MTFAWRPETFPARDRPPVQPRWPEGTFPRHLHGQLSCGLTWMAIPARHVDLVHFLWVTEGGWRADRPRTGIPELIARCMPEGTIHRSGLEIAFALERAGARIHVQVEEDATYWHCTSLAHTWTDALDIFLDVLSAPSFPADVVHRESRRWVQQIEAARATPAFLAEERLRRALFDDHPYGQMVPHPEYLLRVHRWDLFRGYLVQMDLRRTVCIVIGAVDPDTVLRRVEQTFTGWPITRQWTASPAPSPPRTGWVHWVDRPGSVQTEIWIGIGLPTLTPDDWCRGRIASTVLGGGAASRLFVRLREEKGYTYGAYSRFRQMRDAAWWIAATQVRAEVTRPALMEMRALIESLWQRPPDDEETATAIRHVLGRFFVHHQTLQSWAQRLSDLWLYQWPEDFWTTYRERLIATTPDDVVQIAQRWTNAWQVVCVGDHSAALGSDGDIAQHLRSALGSRVRGWTRWTILGEKVAEGTIE